MVAVQYFDSSALIKHYIDEDGSAQVDRLFAAKQPLITSALTYAEVYAALHRLRRANAMSGAVLQRLCVSVEDDWQEFSVVELHEEIRQKIPQLCRDFPLRGCDAVHLASALSIAERGARLQFICADRKLLNAAQDAGLAIIDPTAA